MKIGFFDSGVGGITVLSEALRQLPQEDYLYFADTDHVPYGLKTKEEVRKLVLEAVEFMWREGIKALVVACNTATSIAINDLRRKYSIPILGMEPAVKPAVENNGSKRVLVTATPLTLQEEKYQNLVSKLDHAHIVDGVALPELVEYAERFIFAEEVIVPYLRQKLAKLDLAQYGTVVLGCTHFSYFKNSFQQVFPLAKIIDGSLGTVNHLKNTLLAQKLISDQGKGEVVFYTSGRKEGDDSRYYRYLELLKQGS
ncbi:MAG TPA: glutamate racemase [Peptococcaceae bacterium]|nr:glutamate racemase [Peptococcaceae bacterium]